MIEWFTTLLAILAGLTFLAYKFFTRKYDYWKKRGVFFLKPLPVVGNAWAVLSFKRPLGAWYADMYNSTDKPYCGIYILDEPAFLLKSPQLIKQITCRDFNYFSDRSVACPRNKLVANMMFMQKNPDWRILRNKVSPAFSSGKMKGMLALMKPLANDLVNHVSQSTGVQEAKEICSKFTIDVISLCGFGINAHCFEDENAMFRQIGKAMFDFTCRNASAQFAYFCKPSWVNWFKLDFFEPWVGDYLTDVIKKTLKTREETNYRANDFVDILGDILKIKDELNLESEQITAQSIQFFAAGFETTASTVAYALYELAINPDIQDKLREEMISMLEGSEELSYENLIDMKYLELCILEVLRKYPPLPFIERKCVEDYNIPGTNFVLEKGMLVIIPMFGLHYDEKYFPEPMKFIPERYLENINTKINGMAYVPFGSGPRNCIGERFGMLICKMAVAYMVLNFEIQKCEETPDPLEFEAKTFTIQSKVGLPLIFQKIECNFSII